MLGFLSEFIYILLSIACGSLIIKKMFIKSSFNVDLAANLKYVNGLFRRRKTVSMH